MVGGGLVQVFARGLELSFLGDRVGGAQPRRQRVLAVLDLLVPLDGARPLLLLLGDLAEDEARAVRVAIVGRRDEALHVLLGDRVVLELQGE